MRGSKRRMSGEKLLAESGDEMLVSGLCGTLLVMWCAYGVTRTIKTNNIISGQKSVQNLMVDEPVNGEW